MQSFTFWNIDPKVRIYLTSVWLYEENPLEHVDGYCYLGITLHFSGNFKRAQNMLRSKAIRAFIPLFIQKNSNFKNLPIKFLLKLFSTTIIPILLYNCEIWGPYLQGKINSFEIFKSKIFKVINEIERFHLKFCKRILGVHSKTTNIAICAELGRIPLIAQISLHIVNKLH